MIISYGRDRERMCPVCHTIVDAFTSVSTGLDAHPAPGNLSVCGYCSSLLVFTKTSFRVPTKTEIATFPPDMMEIAHICQQIIQQRKH